MIELDLAEIADLVDGDVVGNGATVVTSVGADSRDLDRGALFLALRGDRDGHDFVADAFTAGAGAAMVERNEVIPTGKDGIVVADVWAAVARLAGVVRGRIAPRVVAVTGSVGKTTTKDLIAAACGGSRNTVAAVGSYNNELGVPLTLLELTEDTEVLVVEVGSRGVGHIGSLMPIVRPDIAVVTAVGGGAHLEQFGSIDVVARAKAELVAGLRPSGVAVLNLDDPMVNAMAGGAPGRVVTFSAQGLAADLSAHDVAVDANARPSFTAHTPVGRQRVRLPISGRHNIGNALAALAAAINCGVDLEAAASGIQEATVSRWRSEIVEARGIRILNDAYNSNPTSAKAALDTLAAIEVTGRRWAVLGVMAEMGSAHEAGHVEVGRHAAECADIVMVIGDGAQGIATGARDAARNVEVVEVSDVAQALTVLAPRSGDGVLVKASRVAGLERVAQGLIEGSAT